MQTPATLRQEADDAQDLASIVAYGEDKQRLTRRAEQLRRQADELERLQTDHGKDADHPPRPRIVAWLSTIVARH